MVQQETKSIQLILVDLQHPLRRPAIRDLVASLGGGDPNQLIREYLFQLQRILNF